MTDEKIYICWTCDIIFNLEQNKDKMLKNYKSHKKKGHDVEILPENWGVEK